MTKKSIQKPAIAPLTARASTTPPASSQAKSAREAAPNPWLSKKVAQRLEEARTLLLDMAADLPFDMVLRGRVAQPREDVLAQAEPLARLIQHFTPQALGISIDANYIRERRTLIDLLGDFEKAGENFLGLIRRTRAVMAAQLEKAMRDAYLTATESAPATKELTLALSPLAPALASTPKK